MGFHICGSWTLTTTPTFIVVISYLKRLCILRIIVFAAGITSSQGYKSFINHVVGWMSSAMWYERAASNRTWYPVLEAIDIIQTYIVTKGFNRSVNIFISLQRRYNGRDGFSNHRALDCLLNRLSKHSSNIKAPRHWPLWGEFTGHRWISRTKCQ